MGFQGGVGFVFVGVGLLGAPFIFVGAQSVRGKVTARGILENSIGSIGLGLLTFGFGVFLAVNDQLIPAGIAFLAGIGLLAAGVLALTGRRGDATGRGAQQAGPHGPSTQGAAPASVGRARATPSYLCPHCGARVAAVVRGTGKEGETICASPPGYRRCRECNRRVATREGLATALGSGIGFALFAWLVVFVKVLIQARGKLSAVFAVPTVPEACALVAITVFFFLVPLMKYWFLNARLDPADR
jgi:hypothetical protein